MSKMRRRFALVWVALYAAVVASGPMVATAADSGWTIQSLPTPALAPNGQLTGVSCATNTDCMAVGVAQNTAGHDITLHRNVGWRPLGGPAHAPNRRRGGEHSDGCVVHVRGRLYRGRQRAQRRQSTPNPG